MNSPCNGCTERKPGCHGSCLKYEDWKIENAAMMDWLREKNHVVISYSVIRRAWKKKRYGRKHSSSIDSEYR